jgi:Protein of unknown function (DUF1566)
MNKHTLPEVLPAIGTFMEGGHFGGVIRINDALFGVIWAPKEGGETTAAWAPQRNDVQCAMSCFDSVSNTKALAEAGSQLAAWALGLTINGFSDWCIPARDVLELAYRHLKPTTYETGGYFRDGDNPSSVPAGYPYREKLIEQTALEQFQEGNAEAFEEEDYWSSTQSSDDRAWCQVFGYGSQGSYGKSAELRARAVRLIQLSA